MFHNLIQFEGVFTLSSDGSIYSIQPYVEYDYSSPDEIIVIDLLTGEREVREAPAELPYIYEAVQARTFEYAYEVLSQDGIAVAIIVDGLTEANLMDLLALDKEVGILVLFGQIVLFTSGDDSELRLLRSVIELARGASFIAHTQPIKATGPSDVDLANAGDLIEFAITVEGAFSYTREGLISVESFTYMLEQMYQAIEGWDGTPEDEFLARAELHRFIDAMEFFTELPEEYKLLFRAGDFTIFRQVPLLRSW